MAMTDSARLAMRSGLGESPGKEVADLIDNHVTAISVSTDGKIVGGAVAVSNATSVAIVTGLTTVSGFSCQQKLGTAPTISTLTHLISGGTVTVYFWGPTAAGNTALTAVTTSPAISWIATGV